jgi:hypothetical protein
MSGPPTLELSPDSPDKHAIEEFAHLAPEHRIRAALEALERNGITTHFVEAEAEARDIVRSILPPGAEV